jgi:hypothetical protein
VSGLPEQEGEFVLGRVSEIARAAGVPLAGEQCRPNLFVWVTSHPKELLQALENRNFQFRFGVDVLPTVVDEFIATPRAVRIWYSSDIEDRWGSPVICQFANIRVRASSLRVTAIGCQTRNVLKVTLARRIHAVRVASVLRGNQGERTLWGMGFSGVARKSHAPAGDPAPGGGRIGGDRGRSGTNEAFSSF